MNLDLTLVRSFVRTAEELHFGSAAELLHLTQQALSKRIRRLEEELGVVLFMRTTRRVTLTAEGRRFLPHARELLAAADAAVLAVRETGTPLRVDVLDTRLAPRRLVEAVREVEPELRVEVSMRRSMQVALGALERGEIDVAFGRVGDVTGAWPSQISHRLVRLEPIAVVVAKSHPFAKAPAVTVAALRPYGAWVPDPSTALEWGSFVRRFSAECGVPVEFLPQVASQEELVGLVERERCRPSLTGSDMSWPETVRVVPIVAPVPVYPWSVAWLRGSPADSFVRAAVASGGGQPAQQWWVPAADRLALAGRLSG
jgi:DNA-binding transcriptional LysR family regulator